MHPASTVRRHACRSASTARTPCFGNATTPGTSSLTTGWYRLPARSADRPLLTVAVAGFVAATDPVGAAVPGARWSPSSAVPARTVPFFPSPAWPARRHRPADVAQPAVPPSPTHRPAPPWSASSSTKAAPGQWVALTPPRVPKLATLNDVVGSTDPVFIDWVVGWCSPANARCACRTASWKCPSGGSCPTPRPPRRTARPGCRASPAALGISTGLLTPTLVPTYLRNNWGRDWGGLQRFTEIVPAPPADSLGTARRSGLWNPAPCVRSATDNLPRPILVLRLVSMSRIRASFGPGRPRQAFTIVSEPSTFCTDSQKL